MTSSLGALDIPVSLGASATPFVDPVVMGLLDFLGHCINDAIGDRLSQIRPGLTEACPAANRHAYDPRQSFVRNAMPALYIWWGGRSKNVEHTVVRNRRDRDLNLLYVCGPVMYPDGAPVLAGVPAAVDAAIAQASDRGYHPTYGSPPGTLLARQLAPPGQLGWEYTGGQVGILEPIPRRGRKTDPNHQEDTFPALQGTIKVMELRVDSTAGDEVLEPGSLTITVEDFPILTRNLSGA